MTTWTIEKRTGSKDQPGTTGSDYNAPYAAAFIIASNVSPPRSTPNATRTARHGKGPGQ
jgi:hypothetical protein